jgi:chromosome segregation ATPase
MSGFWGRAQRDELAGMHQRLDTQRERLESQRERLDKQRDRIDRYGKQTENLRAAVTKQASRLDRLNEVVTDLREELKPLQRGDGLRNTDLRRMSSQLAAVEERLGKLDDQVHEPTGHLTDAETAEARRLIDEIRNEHEQIRVRMQVVSSYEERLRRVEIALLELYDSDLRDPI